MPGGRAGGQDGAADMALESWIAFVLASAALLVIPGPTILLVIGQSLGAGRRNVLPLVAGVAAGDLAAMSLSLATWARLLCSVSHAAVACWVAARRWSSTTCRACCACWRAWRTAACSAPP